MNNLLRLYSNHADAPDIPNEMALLSLLDKRIVNYQQGKLRYEHNYNRNFVDLHLFEYDYLETIDHGEEQPK